MKKDCLFSPQTWFGLISGIVIILITLYAGYTFFQEKTVHGGSLIQNDIAQIVSILKQIDSSCDILSIRSGRNPIDFLQVEKFASSEIGPLNLAHPNNWAGPYLQDNLTYDERPYDLIATKKGFYVVPGYGARLPNGTIMGHELMLTQRSNIDELIEPGGKLFFDNRAFAQKLDFVIGDWDARGARKKRLDSTKEELSDLAEQLPFTKASSSNQAS